MRACGLPAEAGRRRDTIAAFPILALDHQRLGAIQAVVLTLVPF